MSLNQFLALVCIILGFIVAAFNGVHILFGPLEWYVAALAFEFLALPAIGPFVRRPAPTAPPQ
jgi:hypothetical protein